MPQGNQGGGNNNANKKAKRAAAVADPQVSRSPGYPVATRAPGGRHIVGDIPTPEEVTSRPGRR